MALQLSELSERGVLSQRRSKSLHSHLAARRRADAPAVPRRRRFAAGVLAVAPPNSGQELEGAPMRPPRPTKGVSRLAQIAAGAAMLLPLAAASLGLHPGIAHAARPQTAPVAERSGPSTVIDEESGTAQPWLYSRGPWNQKQYATIHEFYAEPGKLRKARGGSSARSAPSRSEVQQQKQAAGAAAAAPATDRSSAASAVLAARASEVGSAARHAAGTAKQAAGHAAITAKQAAGHAAITAKQAAGHAAITAKQAAGHAAITAKGAAGTATQAVGHAASSAKQAAGTAGQAVAGYAHDFAARVEGVGAQAADHLAATDLNDPQTQKALAAMSAAMLALFIFAARQRSLAGSRRRAFDSTSFDSGAIVSADTDTDTDADREESSRSPGGSSSSGGGAALAMAGASTARWADMSLEERQVEAARRITSAKRRIMQVKAGQDERAASDAESEAEEEKEAEAAVPASAAPAAPATAAPAAPSFPPAVGAVGAAAATDRVAQRQMQQAAEKAEKAAAAADREAQRQAAADLEAQRQAAAACEAQRQRQEAEAAVLVDSQVIAEGGSVGKLTTDAAAAQAVAAEAAAAQEKERLARLAGQLESRDKGAEQALTAAAAPAVEKSRLQKLAGLLWRRDKAATAAVAEDLAATREKERLAQLAGVLEGREETATQGMAEEAAAAAARAEEAAAAAEQERLGQLAGVLQARAETAAQGMADYSTLAAEKARLGQLAGVLEARDEAAESALVRVAGRPRGDTGEGYLETSKDPAAPSLVLFGFLAAAADALGPLLGRRSSTASPASTAGAIAPTDSLVPAAATARQQQQQRASQWDALSIFLAPAAPLLASIVGSRREVSKRNKYDMLLDVLAAAAAAPEVQGNSRYDPVRSLLALAPPSGIPRYDFARSLLRGMAAADTAGGSTFDMAAGLLQSVHDGSVVPTGASKYDPVWPLLKEATMLQEWGVSKFDPMHGLSDWVSVPSGDTAFAGLRHDPWTDLVAAARSGKAAGNSKYDPLPALLSALSGAADAPAGASRYDPAAGLLALAGSPTWQGPTGSARYCMVAAALDAAAGWQAPQGSSKYDPAAAVLSAEAPSKSTAGGASRRWDPVAWLLEGWAANSSDWEPALDGGSKFDPAPAVLGAAPPRHGSKFDPVEDVTAGTWEAPGRSVPANSAGATQYGGGMTQQQQQPPREPAPLGAQTGGWM